MMKVVTVFHRCGGLVLAASLAAAVAVADGESPGGAAHQRPDVVLITLDTTRADHLGAWGWRHAHTPNLDALARRGSRFLRCDASSPLTLPSHASILTGLYPPRHGVRDNGTFTLAAGVTTVAEVLSAAGFDTAAVVSAAVLERRFGLDQGFGVYDDDPGIGHALGTLIVERDARRTTDAALAVLSRLERPFFLWVHYFDPHAEYHPPSQYVGQVSGPNQMYDAEIAYVDAELGRLLAAVPEAWIVAVGDHGEMLGEHGEPTHGVLVYRGARRVPLIVAGPGADPGREVTGLVRTVDVAPTLLALAGAAAPAGLDGRSLLLLRRGETEPRWSYCEALSPFFSHRWYPLRAISDGRWLYLDAPRPSLYDLGADPEEARDLSSLQPKTARRLERRLVQTTEGLGEALHDDLLAGSRPSPEERERLAALGYLEASPGGKVDRSLADPRQMTEVIQTLEMATGLTAPEPCQEALPRLRRALEASPHSVPVLTLTGRCLSLVGKPGEALPLFERGAAEDPRSAAAASYVAECLRDQGRVEEAIPAFRRAVELDPGAHRAALALARLLRGLGRDAEALQVVERALAAGSRHPDLYLERGFMLARSGDVERALADFREACRRNPTSLSAWEHVAMAAYQLQWFEESARAYEQVVKLSPRRTDIWKSLGAIYLYKLDNRDAAISCFRRALQWETDARERQVLQETIRSLEP